MTLEKSVKGHTLKVRFDGDTAIATVIAAGRRKIQYMSIIAKRKLKQILRGLTGLIRRLKKASEEQALTICTKVRLGDLEATV